jgi:hypothetical protein
MMKLWALVGFFTTATIPWAAAAVDVETVPCQPETRGAVAERIAPSSRQLDGEHNGGGGAIAAREGEAARVEAREVQEEAATVERRREPKPRKRAEAQVPDAVLIGRGGAL